MVNKSVPRSMQKNIVAVKWVFKKKIEQDNSIRFKSRVVIKGYMQVLELIILSLFHQYQVHHQSGWGLGLCCIREKMSGFVR